MQTINCKGKLIDLKKPKIMGVLNITPDSFYDGSTNQNSKFIVDKVNDMLANGATFIDIGGYSSRPNASDVSTKEELKRVLPIIDLLIKEFPEILISIDTFRAEVAEKAINKGACIINDISAGNMDKNMYDTVADLQVPYIIMHMVGTPQTMQNNTNYDDIIKDIIYYFSEITAKLNRKGVNDIVIDLGFGFSKTIEQNYHLLNNLELFKVLEQPILTGVSRKSMLYKPLGIEAKDALNATTVANTIALSKGTSILRVHDVKQAMEAVNIMELLNNTSY
ncbi:MAG: dihydropteroate synthase [Flavobacteriaceae bacterium]|nr:dihydropteroate synthase [Flavobacteriaceae bacterium]